MTDISQDELTVLLIAAQGEPMIPIGRWAEPTRALVKMGYLKPHGHPGDPTGHFNHYITPEGMAAAKQSEDQSFREVLNVSASIQHEQKKARAHAEQIAVQMVDLAELSHKITGDPKADSLERWSGIILRRAQEMLR